jgi:hypothetical protein
MTCPNSAHQAFLDAGRSSYRSQRAVDRGMLSNPGSGSWTPFVLPPAKAETPEGGDDDDDDDDDVEKTVDCGQYATASACGSANGCAWNSEESHCYAPGNEIDIIGTNPGNGWGPITGGLKPPGGPIFDDPIADIGGGGDGGDGDYPNWQECQNYSYAIARATEELDRLLGEMAVGPRDEPPWSFGPGSDHLVLLMRIANARKQLKDLCNDAVLAEGCSNACKVPKRPKK